MPESVDELKKKVALACRILAMEGLIEGILGHVSARIEGINNMLIRCRGDDECGVFFTTESAVRQVNFDGHGPGLGEYHEIPKELPIHGEMYKMRPDIGCVIHAHPPSALLCGIAELPFRPIFGAFNIPAMRLALEGIPIFPYSFLVSRPELAAAMIEVMGQKHVCLMRGHGVTVTGRTVEEATIRALNFNTLARVTVQLAQLGRQGRDISPQDIGELPDLGSRLNDTWVWRYYARMAEEVKTPRNYWQ